MYTNYCNMLGYCFKIFLPSYRVAAKFFSTISRFSRFFLQFNGRFSRFFGNFFPIFKVLPINHSSIKLEVIETKIKTRGFTNTKMVDLLQLDIFINSNKKENAHSAFKKSQLCSAFFSYFLVRAKLSISISL